MDATLKNVGKTPASGSQGFGNVVTDQGEFEASYEEDVTYSDNLQEAAKAPASPFNPGDTAKVVKVWSVTAGAKPLAVLFPDTTVYSGPTHRISL